MIEHIPLATLTLSPLNPRKTEPTVEEIAELAASIAENGMLQNLIGWTNPDTGRVEIVGGGRRLRALQSMPEMAAASVAVEIIGSREQALAAAIAENEARVGMTAFDRLDAYMQKIDVYGWTVAECARSFGVSTLEVERVIVLRHLAPDLLAAARAGEMSVDQARAFAITTDHAAQRSFFAHSFGPNTQPSSIRAALKTGAIKQDRDKRVRIMGLEPYVEKGGRVTRDLFDGEVFIEDPEIFEAAWTEWMAARCAEYVEAGWAWAEPRPQDYYKIEVRTLRATEEVELPEGDAARLAELTAKREAYEEGDEEAITEEEWDELDDLSDRIEMRHSEDAMSVSGVWLFLDYDGRLGAQKGVIRPEDMDKAVDLGLIEKRGSTAGGSKVKIEDGEKSAYGDALSKDLRDLAAAHTALILAANPELALDVLAWNVARLTPRTLDVSFRAGSFAGGWAEEQMPSAGTGRIDDTFAAFMERPKAERRKILAIYIGNSATSQFFDATAEHFDLHAYAKRPLRKDWTPNTSLFSRLNAAELRRIYFKVTQRSIDESLHNPKKAEIVAKVAALFADPKGVAKVMAETYPGYDAAAMVERARAWLPDPLVPKAKAQPEPDEADDEDEQDEAA